MKTNTTIVLLRAVNVGGNNKLPMRALTQELATRGLDRVQTYIQSGNLVVRTTAARTKSLERDLRLCISEVFGFEPRMMLLDAATLQAAATANPFPHAGNDDEGKRLHLFFLEAEPNPSTHAKLRALCKDSEQWRIIGQVLYLYAPDGVGDSKFAKQAEKVMGVGATARNWRTVSALLELASELET